MPTREKRLERARENPKNVRFDTLCRILEENGAMIRPPKGSHYVVSFPGTSHRMTVVHENPVKRFYVERALEMVDEVSSEGSE
jgi:hypothetical protein